MAEKPTYEELKQRIEEFEKEAIERKRSEDALRESERLYRLLADNVNDIIWTMDMEMKYTYFSPSVTRMIGYSVEEVMAQSIEESVTPASLDIIVKAITEELEMHNKGQKPQDRSRKVEVELYCKDGSILLTEIEANFLYNADGQPQSIIGVTRDITARKQAEEALRESEKNLKAVLDASPVGIGLAVNRKMGWANETMHRMIGYNQDSLLGQSTRIFYPDDKEFERAGRELYDDIKESGTGRTETRLIRKDGTVFDCIIRVSSLDLSDPAKGQIFAATDITERKRAEEKSAQQQEQLLAMFDGMDEVVYVADPETNELLYLNRAAKDSWGDRIGETCHKVLQNRDSPCPFCSNDEIFGKNLGKTYIWELQNEVNRKWYRCIDRAIRWSNEKMVRFELAIDLTERKQMEEALRKSEALLRTLIRTIPDLVWLKDQQGIFLLCNSRFESFFGAKEKDIIGKTDYDFVDKELADFFRKHDQATMAKGESSKNEEEVTFADDGHREILETIKTPMCGSDGQLIGVLGIGRDITDRKRLEAQLQQAQKMEAIGTLAGGIAHDFNNLLYAIIGYTELSMDAVPEGSRARRNLQEVLKAADRAKNMIQQILTFSRKTEKEKNPINVQSVLKEVVNLLRASLPSTIEIRQDIDANCGPVMADPTQIHEIIMNLGTNGYHAMREKGGVLGITLIQEEIGSDDSKYDPDLHPGPYLKLTIEDTGHGIDSNVMEKIFNPYFTTKGVGEGTGMGLSIVHGIIKDHGGDIRVYSEPGKGTAFNIYLPVIETGTVELEIISTEPAPTGTERILFVDDEEPIVNMVRQILEDLGYHVTPRTSSVEALEAFRAKPDEFDLVITDMTMPNKTGAELALRLLEIRSDIPIILCTGFSELMDEKKAKAIGIREHVMKPIVRDKIAGTIRKVLDEGKEE
jgi:PAS domain S-box-containing protein